MRNMKYTMLVYYDVGAECEAHNTGNVLVPVSPFGTELEIECSQGESFQYGRPEMFSTCTARGVWSHTLYGPVCEGI